MAAVPTIVAEPAEGGAADPLSALLSPGGAGAILHVTPSAQGAPADIVRLALERAREADREARWATVTSEGRFGAVGERLTASLQGLGTDGGELGEPEHDTYTSVLSVGAEMLAEVAPSFELAFVHDPSTAGLCRPLKEFGARVVWACHVDVIDANEAARAAWEFLVPHIESADALIFLRQAPAALGRPG